MDGEAVQSEAPDRHPAEPGGTEQSQQPDDHRKEDRDRCEQSGNERAMRLSEPLPSSPLLLVLTAIVAGVGIVALIIVGFG